MEEDRRSPGRRLSFESQFGNPTGLLGMLVGHLMAVEHRTLHRTVVDRLSLRSNDVVLEIGFGPGTAIRRASQQASTVSGVEISREMVQQATRRNYRAVRSGRVELRRASAASLPFPDSSFTVAFEVNTFHHWEDPVTGLKEIHRVLRQGGRLLLVLRKGKGPLAADIRRATELLERRGFTGITSEEHSFGHGGAFVEARRA